MEYRIRTNIFKLNSWILIRVANYSLKKVMTIHICENFLLILNIASSDKSANWTIRILKVSKVRNYKEEVVNSDQDRRIDKD